MYVYIYNFTAEIAAYTCFRVCASVLFLGTNGSHDRKNTKYVLPAEEPRGLWSSAGPVGGREGGIHGRTTLQSGVGALE